jgi:hypothetical protein
MHLNLSLHFASRKPEPNRRANHNPSIPHERNYLLSGNAFEEEFGNNRNHKDEHTRCDRSNFDLPKLQSTSLATE